MIIMGSKWLFFPERIFVRADDRSFLPPATCGGLGFVVFSPVTPA
ncbi:MAG: hypothetical protein ACK4NP_10040 [Parvularculaceae bacterium]